MLQIVPKFLIRKFKNSHAESVPEGARARTARDKFQQLRFWDRETKQLKVEQVYGGLLLNWLYGSKIGIKTSGLLAKPAFSRAYGFLQSTSFSKTKINSFVKQYDINMSEFENRDYASFNEFFIRKFRANVRPFEQNINRLPAFTEARYLAYDGIKANQQFPIKGQDLSPELILGDKEKARPFVGGGLLIARLCPVDYHRFHFPDDGVIINHNRIPGQLHSVNPVALQNKSGIFVKNERQVTILNTKHFGLLAYVEVGALCVGKIIQTFTHNTPFDRGDEKGYFLFGASTVIIFGEPGKWKPDQDLLAQTAQGRESFVKLGQGIAEIV